MDKRIILLLTALPSFLVPYTVSSIAVALPAIGEEFSLDAVSLGWITSAYVLTAAVCILPFGKLSDIYGRKRFFIIGNVIFTAGCLLAVVSWSGPVLIIARVIQGLGGSMVFSTSIAVLTSVFPMGERGRAIGIVTGTVYAGLSIGPFLGGILTQHFGWPSIFLVNIPIGILVIIATLVLVPGEWAEQGARTFDLSGAVLYGAMLIGILYGLTLLPSTTGILLMAAGFALLAGFVWWERRQISPMLDLSLFRKNPVFLFSNVAAMINYAVVFAVSFLLSLYLQYIRGFDPQTAGIILVSMPVVQMVVAPLAGNLSDRIDAQVIATAGMACTTAGLAVMALLSPGTSLVIILAGLVLLGLGYGLFSSPNTNAIMSSVGIQHLGIASAMVSTMRSIGQMLSMAIAMLVFSVIMGTVVISPEVYPELLQSITVAFTIFFFLALFGIWTSYARGKSAMTG